MGKRFIHHIVGALVFFAPVGGAHAVFDGHFLPGEDQQKIAALSKRPHPMGRADEVAWLHQEIVEKERLINGLTETYPQQVVLAALYAFGSLPCPGYRHQISSLFVDLEAFKQKMISATDALERVSRHQTAHLCSVSTLLLANDVMTWRLEIEGDEHWFTSAQKGKTLVRICGEKDSLKNLVHRGALGAPAVINASYTLLKTGVSDFTRTYQKIHEKYGLWSRYLDAAIFLHWFQTIYLTDPSIQSALNGGPEPDPIPMTLEPKPQQGHQGKAKARL